MADDEEGVVDNWEDADTDDLERRMEERHKQLQPIKVVKIKTRPTTDQSQGPSPPGSSNTHPNEPQTQLPLKIHDSDRTEYVAPIKILKRKTESSPQSSSAAPQPPNPSQNTKQYKTLAEREAAYASARARILGSDYRTDESTPTNSPSQTRGTATKTASPSEGIKRQPKGPSDSKGFVKSS